MKKLAFFVALPAVFLGFLFFLAATTKGLITSIRLASLFLPGTLSLSGVEGTLIKGFSFVRLKYGYKKQEVALEGLKLNWSLKQGSFFHAQILWSSLIVPLNEHQKFISKKGHMNFSGSCFSYPNFKALLVLSEQSQVHLSYTADKYWKLDGQIKSPDLFPLQTTAHVQGQFSDWMHGKISFVVDKGQYILPEGKRMEFGGAHGTIVRNSESISLNAILVLDSHNHLKMDFLLPDLNNKHLAWRTKGLFMIGDSSLNFEGKGFFLPEPALKIHLWANALPLRYTQEYQCVLSPDLWLSLAHKRADLKGKIQVPQALIAPKSFHNTEVLSKDALFVDEKPKTSLPLKVEVEVQMGNAVHLSALGLKGRLTGSVFLRQDSMNQLTATGALDIAEGTFKAYGQDLTINQGRVLFTGGALDSPQLAVRASKLIKKSDSPFTERQATDFLTNLTVGVDVSGSVESPALRLFSNPASLSQADILSFLLLGKPVSQANKAGGQLLLAAIASMGNGRASQGQDLLNQVQKKLAMDIHFENGTRYNQATRKNIDSNAIVVGKSLSKRLYVSYNMGLSQADVNVLTLKYLISKFFSLQVNTSTAGSGIDLLYTKE